MSSPTPIPTHPTLLLSPTRDAPSSPHQRPPIPSQPPPPHRLMSTAAPGCAFSTRAWKRPPPRPPHHRHLAASHPHYGHLSYLHKSSAGTLPCLQRGSPASSLRPGDSDERRWRAPRPAPPQRRPHEIRSPRPSNPLRTRDRAASSSPSSRSMAPWWSSWSTVASSSSRSTTASLAPLSKSPCAAFSSSPTPQP
jgi:hypothetical protein